MQQKTSLNSQDEDYYPQVEYICKLVNFYYSDQFLPLA